MKNVIILCVMLLGILTGKLLAQAPDTRKEKMKALSAWIGRWQGEGSLQMGPGEPKKSSVDEHIEYRLDEMLLVVEGVGKATDPATGKEAVVHHAFGVISFDQPTNAYKFKTYLKDGRGADAWFIVTGENIYQWGFDTPSGKIRYNIILNVANKTWNEIGEFSADGTTWMKFFEMNLRKVE
jgi:hypothetical protein